MIRISFLLVMLAACDEDHGETPPPRCGDAIADVDEECDDGNEVAGDGCDRCLHESNCGNGTIDEFELCDDGNTVNDDGCDADCEIGADGPSLLTATWTFQDLDSTVTDCPADFPIVRLRFTGAVIGERIADLGCLGGEITLPIARDQYTVAVAVTSVDGRLFALSESQQLDLRFEDQSFSTVFFNDAGVFQLSWRLVGAESFAVLDCAQANVSTIELSTQHGVSDTFDCSAGGGLSSPLAAGSYSLSLIANDARSQNLATSSELSSTITVPTGKTFVGPVSIRIPGL